jgi:ketosteroid isomerase-like protein
MSQENVEWARRVAEALDRGDLDAVEALTEGRFAPDFEFEPLYLDRVYRADEARQLWADLAEVWEDYRAVTEEILDLGEHLLLVRHITGRGARGGVPVDQQFFMLCRFQGDKIAWAKSFATKREALEAAGLRE